VAIGKRGRIVVAGGPPFAVARYKPSGRLDHSFSQNGKATVNFTTGNPRVDPPWPGSANAVAVGEHGKVVVVGAAGARPTHRGPTAFAIARFKSNGRLDRSFSNNGKLRLLRAGGHNVANAVALDDRGRILIAGRAGAGAAIVRLNSSGEPDRTFAGNGRFYVPAQGGFNSIAIDSRGRIVVGSWDGKVYRYEPNGEPDLSFGNGGWSPDGGIGWIAIDRHDRIVVADYDTVFRLDRNGFAPSSLAAPAAVRVAVDSKQRTVAFGSLHGRELSVSRYLPDWDYDPTLGGATVNFPGKRFLAGGVATDRKDRIVGVGGARDRFALTRLRG
jgi:uncharacterized delta-60 repeat protein